MGSSPIWIAVVLSSAMAKPLVLRLYPLLSVAVLKSFDKTVTRYSVIGVFPVPPTARLPTHIIGKLKDADFKMFLSNNQFLVQMIIPYKKEMGKRRYLKLFSNSCIF
jgi:hypothetical protein